jgi:hypothetical protein
MKLSIDAFIVAQQQLDMYSIAVHQPTAQCSLKFVTHFVSASAIACSNAMTSFSLSPPLTPASWKWFQNKLGVGVGEVV